MVLLVSMEFFLILLGIPILGSQLLPQAPSVHFESFPTKRGFRDECSKQGSRGSVLLTALLSGDGWRLGEVTCLLRDGRDLLPGWHRLKTDDGAVARGLRRGRTWGHWHVPLSPWEGCLGSHHVLSDRGTWLCL